MRVPISSNGAMPDLHLHERKVSQPHSERTTLSLEPVPSTQSLMVNVNTPRDPALPLSHVPCDIVLVIDVSGSMADAAPVPGDDATESTGLSILDLVKHAANTIIESMDETDRLGIVVFDASARIIQHLQPMTPDNKAKARQNISHMQPGSATNLWHGILDAIKTFEKASDSTNVPAMMILTDGMPNHMCPQAGYIPRMRKMMPLPATIHTFGFGYSLDSGLLKSIAEIGNGNYAFIPDAGMIGTVFVHAVANLQATYATDAILTLTYPAPICLEHAMGDSVDQIPPKQITNQSQDYSQLTVRLGNLQYGQSRNVVLRVKNMPALEDVRASEYVDSPLVAASLDFSTTAGEATSHVNHLVDAHSATPKATTITTRRSLLDATSHPDEVVAYHDSRARICNYLCTIFPIGTGDRRGVMQDSSVARAALDQLINDIPARQYADTLNKSLMTDLIGEDSTGQISLAITNESYFFRWGTHYLPSYLNAHTRQICNSFKDAGPLQYSSDCPLFIQCRDRLDSAFDRLPAPEPSLVASSNYRGHVPMHVYNNAAGPCFAGSVPVELASGRTVPIRKLRRGVKVRTPAGPRRVAMVLKTPVQNAVMCRLSDDLLVTPWHPVSSGSGKTWAFPAHVTQRPPVLYSGAIYSVLLQRDRSSVAHALRVDNAWGVTLGHGLISGRDMRAHQFLGDYNNVGKALLRLGPDNKGVALGGGVERDGNGLVCGFKMAH